MPETSRQFAPKITPVLRKGMKAPTAVAKRPPLKPAEGDAVWNMISRLRVVMYGDAATGKTTLWATFPGPILALLCSGGNKPGELLSIDTPENRKKITPKVITGTDQFKSELKALRANCKYETVVLDHASGYQDIILKEILGLEEIPAQRPVIGDGKRTWGEVALQGKTDLRAFLNVPANVIIVAQQRAFEPEDGADPELSKTTVGPALTPSLSGWVNWSCDYVLHLYKSPRFERREVPNKIKGKAPQVITKRLPGQQYCLRTEDSDLFATKFRIPGKPDKPKCIVNPSYDKIMALLRGEKVGDD